VKVGQAVRQGEVLGAIGMTGRATGPHMHWAIKWRDARIDPVPLAGPMER
jgi:murein DD-endopeptidase MepM/ murein hydrolase activator NlpD